MKRTQQRISRELVPPRYERRGGHRLVPPHGVRCELSGRGAKLVPKDVSATGIAVWSSAALAIGRDYDLVITLEDFTLPRRARVVHCTREKDRGWLVGLKFLDGDGRINELIQMVATEFRPE